MNDSLAQLEPEGLSVDGQGWQQRKSVQTRVAILEAAVACLAEHGYAHTTTQMIAKMAGISRGAMLHHYATKQELITAVVDFTCYRRMEKFMAGVRALTEEQRTVQNAGFEIYWDTLHIPEFAAYFELSVAARTDEELREVFLPKARRFQEIEWEETIRAFPEWGDKLALLRLCCDLTMATLQGMYQNEPLFESQERRRRLRATLGHLINLMRDGAVAPVG